MQESKFGMTLVEVWRQEMDEYSIEGVELNENCSRIVKSKSNWM